jgi:pyrroline-5-carboxylate reductase
MNATLGIVGVGRLATFMIEGLRRAGDRRDILLSPRNAVTAAELARAHGCTLMPDNQAVLDRASLVVVATPPAQTLTALGALRWRADHVLISVVAGVGVPALRAQAGAATVVRAMPSAASAIGFGVTPLHPPHPEAEALFGRVGAVHSLPDEAMFGAATALACYHLWLHALMQRVAAAAEAGGLAAPVAASMVAGLMQAAGAMALAEPTRPLRAPLDENGVPGTLTDAGLTVLEAAGGLDGWARAVAAILPRAGA